MMNFATLQAHKEDNSGNSRVHTTAKANDAEKQYSWSYFQINFPTKCKVQGPLNKSLFLKIYKEVTSKTCGNSQKVNTFVIFLTKKQHRITSFITRSSTDVVIFWLVHADFNTLEKEIDNSAPALMNIVGLYVEVV